jgi:hypothetical protein
MGGPQYLENLPPKIPRTVLAGDFLNMGGLQYLENLPPKIPRTVLAGFVQTGLGSSPCCDRVDLREVSSPGEIRFGLEAELGQGGDTFELEADKSN